MTGSNLDRLRRLFEQLQTISFFDRLFSWNKIKNQLIDASGDLQKFISDAEHCKESNVKLEMQYAGVCRDVIGANENLVKKGVELEHLNQNLRELQLRTEKQVGEYAAATEKNKAQEEKINELFRDKEVLLEKTSNLSIDNQRLNEDAATYNEQLSNLIERKSALEATVANKERDVIELQARLNEATDKINILTGEYSAAIAKNSANGITITTLSTENRSLTERNDHLVGENKKLSEAAATSSQLITGLTERKIELDTELATAKRDLEDKDTELQEAIIKIEQLTGEHSAASTALGAQNKRVIDLTSDMRVMREKNDKLIDGNKRLAEDAATNKKEISTLLTKKGELDIQVTKREQELACLKAEYAEVKKQNTQLLKDEEYRKGEHSNQVASLTRIQDQIHAERLQEVAESHKRENDRIKGLKETWSRHQDKVKCQLQLLCEKHTVAYQVKVPFKGEPDNTICICDEYIIFDAKSPGGEDFTNFPNYLKAEAEKAKKYAKHDKVKSDIFFVVPSNALEYMSAVVYNHGDHNVYILPIEALEPVILSLKKIEEYEFAEQLSPDDRDNICRIIGRFAHLTKRRIQIDSFFAQQFMQLVYKCEADLPAEILKAVSEYEKVEKINPPLEKRHKRIAAAEVEKESNKVRNDAAGQGILIQNDILTLALDEIPLYKTAE